MTPANESDPELTPAEAAARAQVSERTIARWIAAKRLPARKHRGRLSIKASDVDRLAQEPVASAS